MSAASGLHHADNRSDRLRFVVATEFRRIERRHRAVEEERVLTAEAVAKQPRERVEGHGLVGDGEADRASLARADAVADLLRGSVRPDLRMHLAVDDQHRPGLRRVARGRRAGEIAAGLGHARDAIADPEHAIRLHVKIRRAAARVGLMQLAPVLDVKADGRLVLPEHAGVHRERELLAFLLQR